MSDLTMEQKFSHVLFCNNIDKGDELVLKDVAKYLVRHNACIAQNILNKGSISTALSEDVEGLISRTIKNIDYGMTLSQLKEFNKANHTKSLQLINQLKQKG